MAKTTFRFTKQSIEAIRPPLSGHADYRDTENKYLSLRITASSKTFYLIRKIRGKMRFIKLGRYPEMTVSEARRASEEVGAALLRGDEPKKQERALQGTFEGVFSRYMEEQSKPHKRTWREDEKNYNRYLKPLAKLPVAEIRREAISKLHARLGENNGKYIANRVLALLKTVFNYSMNTLELSTFNPAAGIKMNEEHSRERFLDGSELQRFFQALNDEATPELWRDFFLVLLWTGARRGNVQSMRWEHIDIDAGLWRIPGSEFKNGDPFTCVLNDQVIDILKRRQCYRDNSPFVFPSDTSKAGHIVEPKKAWLKILKAASLENVRLHDLRRTLGSWQAATGASLQVIGKSLGHRNQTTTAIYARLNLDPVRASITTATAAMLAEINKNSV